MSESTEEKERIQEEITKELTPLLDNLRTKRADYELFKRSFRHFQGKFNRALKYAKQFGKHSGIPADASPSLKDTVYTLFSHVVLVESLGDSILDMIVMLLVANGRDYHIHKGPRIKHVNKIEELNKVFLGNKVSFLKDNDIKELTKLVNTELRNKISHLEFQLKEDNIYIEGKPAYEIATKSSNKLVNAVIHTKNLLDNLAKSKGLLPKDFEGFVSRG
jgi:hypothetical protein